MELGIVLGTTAKNVSVDRALEHVFGYTIGEDISDRDLQKSEKQFGRCKSFDTYTPVGPFVQTEVDIGDLPITLRQNGEVKQQARTSQMIYSAGGDRLLRQSIDHAPAGRSHPDRNAVRGGSDSRGRRAGGPDRRVARPCTIPSGWRAETKNSSFQPQFPFPKLQPKASDDAK